MTAPLELREDRLHPSHVRVRQIIKELNMTQVQFSNDLGINQSTFGNRALRGERMRTDTAYAIQGRHNYSAKWILTGVGPKHIGEQQPELPIISERAPGNSVELIDHTGGDLTHARAAWASTTSVRDLEHDEERMKRMPKLLNMLASEGHGTPFEHSHISFHVRSDIATHIHFLKHRHLSINSESARYKELKRDTYYLPVDWSEDLREELKNIVENSQHAYHLFMDKLENAGVDRKRAKETARYVLPYAHQLEFVVSMNFRAFVHFQQLRNEEHAQLEIRTIAQEMLQQLKLTGSFTHSINAFGLDQHDSI
jgi:thymidylate synthase (FAD)